MKTVCEARDKVFNHVLVRVVAKTFSEIGNIYRGGCIYREGDRWFNCWV